jgi:biotin carboxylase
MDQEGTICFLEINGRLQVEHPVTEMITGTDMIREQIMVAAGAEIEPAPVTTAGHAIECRINAREPFQKLHAHHGHHHEAPPAERSRDPGRYASLPRVHRHTVLRPLLVKLIATTPAAARHCGA